MRILKFILIFWEENILLLSNISSQAEQINFPIGLPQNQTNHNITSPFFLLTFLLHFTFYTFYKQSQIKQNSAMRKVWTLAEINVSSQYFHWQLRIMYYDYSTIQKKHKNNQNGRKILAKYIHRQTDGWSES